MSCRETDWCPVVEQLLALASRLRAQRDEERQMRLFAERKIERLRAESFVPHPLDDVLRNIIDQEESQ